MITETGIKHKCPTNCGLCSSHKSKTLLGIIVATNRCNLNCPICLVKGGEFSRLYEPNIKEVTDILHSLKKQKSAAPTIAFSGGEPTLRDDIPELIKLAHKEGFSRTEVITNGIRLAEDFTYVKALRKSNLSQVGLQFDGLNDEIYSKLRGRPLLQVKLTALENLKKIGQPTILAVTLAKDINMHQIGDLINFAIENKGYVEHINFQLISYTGRAINFNLKNEHRINIQDFLQQIEEQTRGNIKINDFFKPDYIAPVPDFIEAFTDMPQPKFFPHENCSLATYLYVNKTKKTYIPLHKLFSLPKFLIIFKQGINKLANKKGFSRSVVKFKILFSIIRAIFSKLHIAIFRNLLFRMLFQKSFDPLGDLKDVLMVSCENYLSCFDFNTEQAQKCVIHYLFKNEKIIPFCNYNVFLTRYNKKLGDPYNNSKEI